ncbi:MAG: hypothetical protein ABI606_21670 [Rhodoferax sp.]
MNSSFGVGGGGQAALAEVFDVLVIVQAMAGAFATITRFFHVAERGVVGRANDFVFRGAEPLQTQVILA